MIASHLGILKTFSGQCLCFWERYNIACLEGAFES